MKILVFGPNGQMGTIFRNIVPKKYDIIFAARSRVDLRYKSKIEDFITLTKPDIIINFAAYTDVDGSENNQLYRFNSANGGVIVPRGTSIVGLDLRKTKLRPLYVPNPTDDDVPVSSIFRITGNCYFWQLSKTN
mgnify:CR=1 FL=1